MSISLDLEDQALASLPLAPGERDGHMQIELACRFYANRGLSPGQATRGGACRSASNRATTCRMIHSFRLRSAPFWPVMSSEWSAANGLSPCR